MIETDNDCEGIKKVPNKNLYQYLAASSANLVMVACGTVFGWTSPVLPRLQEPNSILPITEDEGTWIAALLGVGAIIGPFPAGVCADSIGRKKTLLISSIFFLISWILLIAGNSVISIYISRIMSGFAIGWGTTLLPIYISEISTPEARGALNVLGQVMIAIGILYVFSIGPYVPYVLLNILCSIIPVLFALSFVFMPESPYYAVRIGNHGKARLSLRKLRGRNEEEIKEELNSILNSVEKSMNVKSSWRDLVAKKMNLKILLLIFGLMAIQQLSGITVVIFYSEKIFRKIGGAISPEVSTIIVGLIMLLVAFPAPYLIERLGRRLIQMVSTAGIMICSCILGIYSYLEASDYDTAQVGWIPLIMVTGFICLHSIGIGSVPWAMMGEMFDTDIRAKGVAVCSGFSYFFALVLVKVYGVITENLGMYAGFWIFSIVSGLGTVFIYYFVPETKGKTLQDIQNDLNV